ncbi:MAG: hypothetical protein ABEL51_03850 [Salinibacter sp.]
MTERNGQSDSEREDQSDREDVMGQRFSSERIVLDSKHFENCTFDTCTLVYRGGTPPNFVRCDFAAPRFVFEGAAKSTVQLMSAIYNGIDERIIEKTFDEIRNGFGNG